jgi:hypothetical protein
MPWQIRVLKYETTAGNCLNELCFMRIEDKDNLECFLQSTVRNYGKLCHRQRSCIKM